MEEQKIKEKSEPARMFTLVTLPCSTEVRVLPAIQHCCLFGSTQLAAIGSNRQWSPFSVGKPSSYPSEAGPSESIDFERAEAEKVEKGEDGTLVHFHSDNKKKTPLKSISRVSLHFLSLWHYVAFLLKISFVSPQGVSLEQGPLS